jgi:hypothetical protein
MPRTNTALGRWTLALTCAAGLSLAGCLERRVSIASDPPGATVWVNDVEVGNTPTEMEFTYFGVYDVRVEKAGFEPLHAKAKLEAPIWEYPGPDLIATVIPARIQTNLQWRFTLSPQPEATMPIEDVRAGLLSRAQALRASLDTTRQDSTRPDTGAPSK